MRDVGIDFSGVWKKYRRGERHDSLRDMVPALARRMFRNRTSHGASTGSPNGVSNSALRPTDFWALRDVSFTVTPGQTLWIIGANGAGKSTVLKTLTRIVRPTRGSYQVRGRIGALIEVAAGFHPDLTGRENIFLQGAIMGMPTGHIRTKFDEIVAFAGIPEFIDTPVKRYSSGMNARLGFAIAAHLDPDVLVIDEVLSVGDFEFQDRAFGRVRTLAQSGLPVVLVSHQLERVAELCTEVVLLDHGQVTYRGTPADAIATYTGASSAAAPDPGTGHTARSRPTPGDSAGAPSPAASPRYESRIAAIGTYAPSRVLTNADLAKMVDTNNDWIVRRTGIRERRVAADDEFTSDLCTAAVSDLLARHETDRDAIGLVIACTTTPDYAFPSVSSQVQARLGLRHAGAVDLNATCAGFVYGLQMANGMIAAGTHRSVVVVAGETLTKVTDYTDRSTSILFGDAAGAVLVERSDRRTMLASSMGADGNGGPLLYRTGISERIAQGEPPGFIRQHGREVYRWAVEAVTAGVCDLLQQANLSPDRLTWFVPHSANLRITEAVCERTGIPMNRTLSSIENHGNTSAATIPLALAPAIADGRIRPGDTILLYGFGGGLVHAGLLLEWRPFGA